MSTCENCKSNKAIKTITIVSGKRSKKQYRVCELCSEMVQRWNPRSKIRDGKTYKSEQ